MDAAALTAQVRREYAAAGVDPTQVETGAVIITGETAKKKNADEILRALAGLAGEFVVTVAGPHLESLIAGRGSGAARLLAGALLARDQRGHRRRQRQLGLVSGRQRWRRRRP